MAEESEKMTREISFPEQERESDARRREGSGQKEGEKERKKWEKWRKKPAPPVDHLTALPPETSTPRALH